MVSFVPTGFVSTFSTDSFSMDWFVGCSSSVRFVSTGSIFGWKSGAAGVWVVRAQWVETVGAW